MSLLSPESVYFLKDVMGAPIFMFPFSGKTPLHVAAQFGQLNVIKILLEFGAALEARCAHQRTPLHLAAAQVSSLVCS